MKLQVSWYDIFIISPTPVLYHSALFSYKSSGSTKYQTELVHCKPLFKNDHWSKRLCKHAISSIVLKGLAVQHCPAAPVHLALGHSLSHELFLEQRRVVFLRFEVSEAMWRISQTRIHRVIFVSLGLEASRTQSSKNQEGKRMSIPEPSGTVYN